MEAESMKLRILAILSLALVIAGVFAVAAGASMPYPPQQGRTEAYYSVVFDGEGEADVAAKLIFLNMGKEPISKIVVEIPGISVRMISSVQEIHERYRTVYTTLDAEKEQLSNSAKYEIKLEQPIAGQETGTVLLRYKATGYAKESLGAFNFKFETAKVAYDVDYVRVAVNVQEGFTLKGGRAGVNYRPDFSAFGSTTEMKAAESTALSGFSSRIIYESGYVKETRGIDPWESFSVKGTYSKSWLRLNIGKVALIVLIFAAVTGGLAFGGAMLMKSRKSSAVAAVAAGTLSAAAIFLVVLVARYLPYDHLRSPLLLILIFVLIAALLLAGLLAPPIFVGIRYGIGMGIATLVTTLLTLICIIFILAAFGGGSPTLYTILQ